MTHPNPSAARTALLVTDWDGTVTRHDFFDIVRRDFLPADAPDYWGGYCSGRYTHFEALAGIFAHLRAGEAEILDAARRTEPDPELAGCVDRLRSHGWEVVIASAGCEWYIRRMLAERGVELPVHSNPGRVGPGPGLHMSLPTGSPYFSPENGIDKAAIVRDGLTRHCVVAYAGDGRPDLPAAKLVPDRYRFARATLAELLVREGLPFVPFVRWGEVADRLLAEPRPC